jgi:hypothetical protein
MKILSLSFLLALATVASAADWIVEIFSDMTCHKYINTFTHGGQGWEFGYSYGIHCAKVVDGPSGGRCQFWADDKCSHDIGNESNVAVGGTAYAGYGEIRCWTCSS